MKRRAPLHIVSAALATLCATQTAHAIPFARRISLRAEGHLGLIVGGTQTAVWSAGAIVRGSVAVSIVDPVSLQLGVTEGIFPTRLSPGTSLNTSYTAGVRVEPRTVRPEGRIFVDANAGLTITGYERRFGFDLGAGWELAASRYFYLGPVVRYSHIYQPDDLPGDPSDAHYLSVGISLMLRPAPPPRTRQGTFLAINAANLPDRDYDGVPDDYDRCGEVPEDHDGFEDEDGCPDQDDDQDGLPDSEDRCPRAAETANAFEDEDGCPDEVPPGRERIEWRDNEIRLRQRVYFPTNRTAVPPLFFPILTELASFLIGHPEIRRLRIEGHSDDRGTRREGFSLSLRRAQAVAAFLVEKGVDTARLEPVGYGDLAPLERVHDEVTRSRNRRIEFAIAQGPAGAAPAPPDGVWTPNTNPLADPPPAPR